MDEPLYSHLSLAQGKEKVFTKKGSDLSLNPRKDGPLASLS
jgi:hypothetical protein